MTRTTGYSAAQIALHWGILILLGVNYFVSEGMGRALRTYSEGGTVAFWPATIHVYVGLAVLVLVLIRLALRLTRGVPDAPESGPSYLRKAGEWSHRLLYALMLAVPALGALAWFGGVMQAGDLHVLVMNVLLMLVGLHAAAALLHQFVFKDRLMLRMMRPS